MNPFVTDLLPYAVEAKQKWPGMRVSVCLSQAVLETGWGAKRIGKWNLWGIKSLSWIPGKKVILTHEWSPELKKMVEVAAEFADFDTPQEAFGCYGRLITNSPTYKDAREAKTLYEYVVNLSKHWATDPNYCNKIMSIIDAQKLSDFDKDSYGGTLSS